MQDHQAMPVSWLPAHRPAWAQWSSTAGDRPWAVQVSEDVMAVDPASGDLVRLSPGAVERLCPLCTARVTGEPDGSAIRLTTSWQASVAAALAECALLRAELLTGLHASGLGAVASGTHPWAEPTRDAAVTARYVRSTEFADVLGVRDLTWGMRVAVGVPTPEGAIRASDGLLAQLPLLLALAANSPYWRRGPTSLASTRTALRSRLAQHGPPRSFGSYDAYIGTVEALVRAKVIGGVGSLGWDVQLRPGDAAIEVSVMDAQTRMADMAGITALVQCLVRLYAEGETRSHRPMP